MKIDVEIVYLLNEAIEVVQRFCFLGDSIGVQGEANGSVIGRIRSEWCKFRKFLSLRTSRELPLSKGRIYQEYLHNVMYRNETWPVRATKMHCIERNSGIMI